MVHTGVSLYGDTGTAQKWFWVAKHLDTEGVWRKKKQEKHENIERSASMALEPWIYFLCLLIFFALLFCSSPGPTHSEQCRRLTFEPFWVVLTRVSVLILSSCDFSFTSFFRFLPFRSCLFLPLFDVISFC